MIDSKRSLKFNETDLSFEPQLDYIRTKEVDISVDTYALDSLLLSFVNVTSNSLISPSIAIMGGIYPNTESNPFFGIVKIFCHKVGF